LGCIPKEDQDSQGSSLNTQYATLFPRTTNGKVIVASITNGKLHIIRTVDDSEIIARAVKGNSLTIECNAVCVYYLRYYSVDKEGNEERVKSAKVQIDNKAPETVYKGPEGVVTGSELECKDSGSMY
jgi:hypothetical protein